MITAILCKREWFRMCVLFCLTVGNTFLSVIVCWHARLFGTVWVCLHVTFWLCVLGGWVQIYLKQFMVRSRSEVKYSVGVWVCVWHTVITCQLTITWTINTTTGDGCLAITISRFRKWLISCLCVCCNISFVSKWTTVCVCVCLRVCVCVCVLCVFVCVYTHSVSNSQSWRDYLAPGRPCVPCQQSTLYASSTHTHTHTYTHARAHTISPHSQWHACLWLA